MSQKMNTLVSENSIEYKQQHYDEEVGINNNNNNNNS